MTDANCLIETKKQEIDNLSLAEIRMLRFKAVSNRVKLGISCSNSARQKKYMLAQARLELKSSWNRDVQARLA
jgi:hypothetical protein